MRFFIIGKCPSDDAEHLKIFHSTCRRLGVDIRAGNHTAIICSPFDDSADPHVLRGMVESPTTSGQVDVVVHFPDLDHVRQQLETLETTLAIKVSRNPHDPPKSSSENAVKYAWLLCQLTALDVCDVIIAIGCKHDGAASMLLRVAEGKRKPILPLAFLGGATAEVYERHRFELEDLLGEKLHVLRNSQAAGELIDLAKLLVNRARRTDRSMSSQRRFFISYPREQAARADHLETLLRRRSALVTRDVSSFGAGYDVQTKIRESIHSADVFVALWCRDYACSQWCFDEIELALERHAGGVLELWILCLDDTRIVPRQARSLTYYNTHTREQLEATVLELLGRSSIEPTT